MAPRRSYKPRYRRKTRTTYATRGVRKYAKRKSYRRRPSMSRAPRAARLGQIPQRLFHVFKYCTSFEFDSSVGALGHYAFRLNSINDPDLTGGGHQPADHDLLLGTSNQLYNKYIVHSCSWSAEIFQEETHFMDLLVGVASSTEGTLGGVDSFNRYCETPGFKRYTIAPAANGGGRNFIKTSGKVMIKNVEAITRLDQQLHGATANSNPTAGPTLNFISQRIDNPGGSTDTLHGKITLWYKCELFDRNLARTTD